MQRCAIYFILFLLITTRSSAVDYEKTILPILEKNCLDCHGPDKQKSKLRVDRRPSLLRGGELGLPAIVPGDPKKSLLIEAIKKTDSDLEMPPKGDGLTKAEITLLEKWITEGAHLPGQMDAKAEAREGADHWSLQAIRKGKPPGDGNSKSAVDAFLNDALAKNSLKQNPPADARSLFRRVSIVLTGLPPSSKRTDVFLKEFGIAPDKAYDKLVDELLASPHFGERWAQHWLDVIRWAETSGSESNYYRKNAWYYRDYVIDAFNSDKPYNQFVRDQIAGDTTGQDAATGFLVSGPYVPGETVGREESAMRQARFDRLNEVVETVGASMMGMTLGCARCHNHKFDPVTIKDYYSMVAVFQDVEFDHRMPKLPPTHPRAIAGAAIQKEIETVRKQIATFGSWEEDWIDHKKMHFAPVKADRIRVTFQTPGWVSIDELEIYPAPNSTKNLAIGGQISTSKLKENPAAPASRMIDGHHTSFWGWAHKPDDSGKGVKNVWVEIALPKTSTVARVDLSRDRFPHYATDFIEEYVTRPFTNKYKVEVKTGPGEWREVASTSSSKKKLPARQTLIQKLDRLTKREVEEGPQPIFAGRFRKPDITHILNRGSPSDPRAEVAASAPEIIDGALGLDNNAPGQKRRVAFSDWLVDPKNPLTSRVYVNRLWHHVFGAGLVTTPGDFGGAGVAPSNPELLDWLAATFMNDDAWSTKTMLKRLVTTRAFRQSSAPNKQGIAADSNSLLLWRFPPRRVEAEVIRDSILMAAGSIDFKTGGPSYRIHNVKRRFQQWEVIDNHGPKTWRRMIYQERMRGIDDLMFTVFDFPDCGTIRAKRPVSTTPLQALSLFNGPLITEQSNALATRIKKELSNDTASYVDRAFTLILGRKPDSVERAAADEILKAEGLPALVRGLFNTNEFAFLN